MAMIAEHEFREVPKQVPLDSSIPLIFFRDGSELRSLRIAEDFVELLSRKRRRIREDFGRPFLQAFECLRRADRYWASDGFYKWLKSGGHLDNRIMVSPDEDRPTPFLWPRRHYAGPELLLDLFHSTSHRLFREVTAQGLSRFYASQGDYQRAKQILEAVVVKDGWPHHYKIDNALYTIDRKIKGQHIPPYLERYLGDDSDHLLKRTCLAPYAQFNVDPEGGVMVCCGEWLRDVKIGNLYRAKGDDIVNSDIAKDVRKSVVDGSFQYCDELRCPLITGQCLPEKSETLHPAVRAGIEQGHFDIAGPAEIILAMDRTCNLTCPSCRTQMISDREEERDRKTAIVEGVHYPVVAHGQPNLLESGRGNLGQQVLSRIAQAPEPNRVSESQGLADLQRHALHEGGVGQLSKHPRHGVVDPHID
jgi:Iron-sulfur cluster-binding domain